MFTWNENNVRPGQFNLKNDFMQLKGYLSTASWIGISGTDSDGGSIDLDRIKEGDILRMGYGGMAAELKITRADTRAFIGLRRCRALDRLSEVYPYDFILLSAFDPAGLASIDYVDAQDSKKLNLTGGTLTGELKMKRTDDVSYWNLHPKRPRRGLAVAPRRRRPRRRTTASSSTSARPIHTSNSSR